jgi:hypothetical protein
MGQDGFLQASVGTVCRFDPEPPEEEPLDNLAQLLLGFLRGEEGGAGDWR